VTTVTRTGRKRAARKTVSAKRSTGHRRTRSASASTTRKSSSRRASATTARKKSSSRRYSKKASNKVGKVMHEFKRGELKSGGRAPVKSRKQAIAIGISEARREGDKVPSRSSSSHRKAA
jgi:hypothetical protein